MRADCVWSSFDFDAFNEFMMMISASDQTPFYYTFSAKYESTVWKPLDWSFIERSFIWKYSSFPWRNHKHIWIWKAMCLFDSYLQYGSGISIWRVRRNISMCVNLPNLPVEDWVSEGCSNKSGNLLPTSLV